MIYDIRKPGLEEIIAFFVKLYRAVILIIKTKFLILTVVLTLNLKYTTK